uniref:Uncharacterized protein n=1 Tax=Tolypiocladia glomerulata TaxID=860646 RepID=A0A1Z1MUE9_9FLOR|nr:hypothetical protein [Tolypiocladia glomerulata]ARW69718.1 hypothetical protein [Tolypiocladia glomerulata]
MTTDIKYMYYKKNNDLNDYYFLDSNQNNDESMDLSTGWSYVCLDDTIDYYADNLNKNN